MCDVLTIYKIVCICISPLRERVREGVIQMNKDIVSPNRTEPHLSSPVGDC